MVPIPWRFYVFPNNFTRITWPSGHSLMMLNVYPGHSCNKEIYSNHAKHKLAGSYSFNPCLTVTQSKAYEVLSMRKYQSKSACNITWYTRMARQATTDNFLWLHSCSDSSPWQFSVFCKHFWTRILNSLSFANFAETAPCHIRHITTYHWS